MNDIHHFSIEIEGQVAEEELNATSPVGLQVEGTDRDISRLTANTDQSGLIGLLRHLHARGLVLLGVYRNPNTSTEETT